MKKIYHKTSHIDFFTKVQEGVARIVRATIFGFIP